MELGLVEGGERGQSEITVTHTHTYIHTHDRTYLTLVLTHIP